MRAHCWLLSILVPPRGFLPRCIPAGWPSTLSLGDPFSRAGLCPSFWNSRRSLLAHSFRLVRLFLTAAQPSGASATPGLVFSTKQSLQPGHQCRTSEWFPAGFCVSSHSPLSMAVLPHLTIHFLGLHFTSLPRGCYRKVLK